MTIKRITVICCDRCGKSGKNGAEFTEYPEGAYHFLGHRADLCDACAEKGYVIYHGKVMLAIEIKEE